MKVLIEMTEIFHRLCLATHNDRDRAPQYRAAMEALHPLALRLHNLGLITSGLYDLPVDPEDLNLSSGGHLISRVDVLDPYAEAVRKSDFTFFDAHVYYDRENAVNRMREFLEQYGFKCLRRSDTVEVYRLVRRDGEGQLIPMEHAYVNLPLAPAQHFDQYSDEAQKKIDFILRSECSRALGRFVYHLNHEEDDNILGLLREDGWREGCPSEHRWHFDHQEHPNIVINWWLDRYVEAVTHNNKSEPVLRLALRTTGDDPKWLSDTAT